MLFTFESFSGSSYRRELAAARAPESGGLVLLTGLTVKQLPV